MSGCQSHCSERSIKLATLLTPERRRRLAWVLRRRLASVTVVLDDFVDPHNVSAVIRSAESLGIQDVHLIESTVRQKIGRRAASGAQHWVSLHRDRDPERCLLALQQQGFAIYGADLGAGAQDLADVPVDRPVAMVLGSEHRGLSVATQRLLDGRFRVPMFGFTESFNVSVAAALSLGELCVRRRRVLGRDGDLDVARRGDLYDRWVRQSVKQAARIELAMRRQRARRDAQ